MSAWQETIVPPPAPIKIDPTLAAKGRRVFEAAGCASCHAGPDLSNHRVTPAPEVGTEPVRASAMKKTGLAFADPVAYGFDTPVPLPQGANPLPLPTGSIEPEQLNLAMAHGDSPGGSKVPSLVGLYWTAPYLHERGVAVGPGPDHPLGMAGTVVAGVRPDPAKSLRALIDKPLRDRVVAANRAHPSLAAVRVTGKGHAYWVDGSNGHGREDQDALIHHILDYRPEAP